jgi:hypothetical protein
MTRHWSLQKSPPWPRTSCAPSRLWRASSTNTTSTSRTSDYVVTSAVGHLVEIQAPEAYDVKRGKWSFAHLPVIPPYFELKPIDKTKTRLNAVVKLAKRKDVATVINACDAGPRGRADLPPDRAVRLRPEPSRQDGAQAGPAPVAAVHDTGRHPRRL